MHKIERQRKHFNKIASRYRQARNHRNHLHLKSLIWHEFLDPHPQLKQEGMQVLEAMCGFADGKKILESTLDIEIRYSGFDYSDEVVARLNQEHPQMEVFHADACQVNLEHQYDLIILLGGLHHIPQFAPEVVERLSKAIRPGGHFISLEPTHGNPVFAWLRKKIYQRNALFDEQTERAFEVDELKDFFLQAGLHQVDCIYPGLLAYILYYNPDAFPMLNIGNPKWVNRCFSLDRLFVRNTIGRAFSFATLSLWQKV